MKNNYNIRDIFLQIELDLIVSLKRNIGRHGKEVEEQNLDYKQWQLLKLRDMERYRKENIFIIGKYSEDIEKIIAESLLENYKVGRLEFNKASNVIEPDVPGLDDTLNQLEKINIELDFYRINDNKLNSLIETVENDFSNANAAVLRRMDDIYRQTIFKTQVPYNTGTITLDKAIDMATKDFLSKGIDAITYSDGKKVNITSYAEMALRTANHRSYLMGEGKRRQQMGLSLVVVSAHATACELCVPWQGLILIDDVYSGGTKEDGNYPLLSTAMEEGLLHPQCRHNLSTYFPGITTLPTVPDIKDVEHNYRQEQKQRYIERQIRMYKRLAAGSIDEVNQEKYQSKVRKWQGIMRNHLADNEQLRRAYRREKIY